MFSTKNTEITLFTDNNDGYGGGEYVNINDVHSIG